METDNNVRSEIKKNTVFFFYIFLVYLGLRALAWNRTLLFEDTDSVYYLTAIRDFLTLDFSAYLKNPDATPFYPFWGAIFSIPGWSVETGARLTSLFFSAVLFLVLYFHGKIFLKRDEVFFGLLLFAFAPVAIALSFGILTEPSYVATIYLGFFTFWKQYKQPTVATACLLGIIFGVSFLNRVEAVLFLFVIPFWQGVYFSFEGRRYIRFKTILKWSLTFLIVFVVIAAPQIYKVSRQLGMFALNGRQVWSAVFHIPGDESQVRRLFGLDYSPQEINIEYLLKNPNHLKGNDSTNAIFEYLRTVASEFNVLYRYRLGELFGPLVLVLFGFGLLNMFRDKQFFNLFLVLSFIGFCLLAPLLHNVAVRHILSIVPIMFLVSGGGIGYLNREISAHYNLWHKTQWSRMVVVSILAACILAWVVPLRHTFNPAKNNQEYSLLELSGPIAIIKNEAASKLERPPNVAAERPYLAYLSDSTGFFLPYADFESFKTYCRLNSIDFFYLNHWRVQRLGYPFYERFKSGDPPGFTTIYRGLDYEGNATTLYRVNTNN